MSMCHTFILDSIFFFLCLSLSVAMFCLTLLFGTLLIEVDDNNNEDDYDADDDDDDVG